jgi:hypothetical protein
MFIRILKRMREAIRLRQYVMTLHAAEEVEDDGFTIYDIERCILNGTITERQKEHTISEWKYLVQGMSFTDRGICVAAKFSVTGKLVS